MIYVTHDQVEAMTLADKIVVLRDGEVDAGRQPDGPLPQSREPLRGGLSSARPR
jgi:ABC-type sugar transport system ATPase subunit